MNESDKVLIDAAIHAATRAYAPYSQYYVGAALLAEDGTVYEGCNVENASYPACICAERTALVKAISEGRLTFTTLAVATVNGGAPCGVCRQMLYEFAPHLRVIMARLDGSVLGEASLSELLPHGFGPSSLPRP